MYLDHFLTSKGILYKSILWTRPVGKDLFLGYCAVKYIITLEIEVNQWMYNSVLQLSNPFRLFSKKS